MASYRTKETISVLGWGDSFSPNARIVMMDNTVFRTLNDLKDYLYKTEVSVGGVTVSVVGDSTAENNGTYEIVYVDKSWVETVGQNSYIIICSDVSVPETVRLDKYKHYKNGVWDNKYVNLDYVKLMSTDDAANVDLREQDSTYIDVSVTNTNSTYTIGATANVATVPSNLTNTPTGLLTNAAVSTVKNYIDAFDCGTFDVEEEESQEQNDPQVPVSNEP